MPTTKVFKYDRFFKGQVALSYESKVLVSGKQYVNCVLTVTECDNPYVWHVEIIEDMEVTPESVLAELKKGEYELQGSSEIL